MARGIYKMTRVEYKREGQDYQDQPFTAGTMSISDNDIVTLTHRTNDNFFSYIGRVKVEGDLRSIDVIICSEQSEEGKVYIRKTLFDNGKTLISEGYSENSKYFYRTTWEKIG